MLQFRSLAELADQVWSRFGIRISCSNGRTSWGRLHVIESEQFTHGSLNVVCTPLHLVVRYDSAPLTAGLTFSLHAPNSFSAEYYTFS